MSLRGLVNNMVVTKARLWCGRGSHLGQPHPWPCEDTTLAWATFLKVKRTLMKTEGREVVGRRKYLADTSFYIQDCQEDLLLRHLLTVSGFPPRNKTQPRSSLKNNELVNKY